MLVSVSNLRINNKPVATSAIKVTDPYPTINWDYGLVDRAEIASNSSSVGIVMSSTTAGVGGYEIRVDDGQSNWGNSSFVGSIVDTGYVETDRKFWRYRGPRIHRGHTYYGQIRLTDAYGNVSDWTTFSFQFNSLPSASNIVLTPASSVPLGDDITLSYDFFDTDGDIEAGSKIWWFRNGIRERQYDGKVVIDGKFVVYGDEWSAQVFPSDGYEVGPVGVSPSVTVSKDLPVASNLRLEPSEPTTADALFARFDTSTADDDADIQWLVNNVAQSADTRLARLNLQPGDSVRFTVRPKDGTLMGNTISSTTVTIASDPLRVTNLTIDSQREPLNLGNLTPTISWSVISQDREHDKVSIRIGTAPNSSNILDEVIELGSTIFVVPSDTLSSGIDYYISVAAGDSDGYGPYTTGHFRTSGSRWNAEVNNATGWTVETTAKISPSDDRPVPDEYNTGVEFYYQGIRIYDGTKYVEIRLYEDRLVFISDTTVEVTQNFTTLSVITVTGKGSNVNVYVNYKLVVDGTGLLTKSSTDKLIEIGAIGESAYTDGSFINLFYTCAGAFEPSSEQYYDVRYEDYYETSGAIDFVTGVSGGAGYYSVSSDDDNESSAIFEVSDYLKPEVITPVGAGAFDVSRIAQDPDNKFTYICHDAGITGMKSYLIPSYDSDLNFLTPDSPTSEGYKLYSSGASPQYVISGLKLDTSVAGGKFYYAQNEIGTKWFTNVSNKTGWTVSFSLVSGATTVDDFASSNTDMPDGAGLYINDGTYWENVYFFPQEIVFVGRGLRIPFDTTTLKEYIVVGKGDSIKLFAKTIAANTYTEIVSTSLVNRATFEANGGRPAVAEADGVTYAVWHDDGAGFKQIYFSSLDNSTTKWAMPRVLVDERYGATQPSIAVDSEGTIYVAYESHRNDGTDIGLIVRNQYGWSNSFVINTAPFNGQHPKIIVDSADNVHLVWEDYRNITPAIMYAKRTSSTGRWSTPLILSDSSKSCTHPSIEVEDENLFVTYTQFASNVSKIYVIKLESSTQQWGTAKLISTGSVAADFSDVAVSGGVVFVVWHDNQSEDFEIYTRRLLTNLTYVSAVEKISEDNLSSRFPVLGIRLGSDSNTGNIYCVFEAGGDLSPYNEVGFSETDPEIHVAYFDVGDSTWVSSNLGPYAYDVVIFPVDSRIALRPVVARRFSDNAHILYEMNYVGDDEYIATTETFSTIRDAVYDLTYTAMYDIIDSDLDLKVSAQLPRREIRFGDFSDARNQSLTFGYFRYYAKDAVEPFEMWVLPAEELARDVVPNQNGDAWMAFSDRLVFFFRSSNEFALTVPEIDLPRRIRFDSKNRIYILNNPVDSEIFVSEDHITFEEWGIGSNIVDFAFAPNGHMWVATNTHAIEYIADTKVILSEFPIVESPNAINSLYIDATGVVWLATSAGLISIHQGRVTTFTPDNSGLLGANVKDLSIRNSGTRYLATAAGLVKMVGNTFTKINITDADWSDDVNVVSWKEPNIIWASGNSKLFQILVDDLDDSYEVVSFTPQSFANFTLEEGCADVLNYVLPKSIDDETLVQLLVNGKVVKSGWTLKGDKLRLDGALLPTDTIQLVIRNDITKYATLEQNIAEKLANGTIERRLKKFLVDGQRVYGATEGDKNQVVVYNQGDTYLLPYDKIALDDQPPGGFLVFEKQLNPRTVQLFIDEADDNLSGLADMVIAIYPNLTTDGTTPADWIPFKERFSFDIGTDFGNQFTEISFDEYTGSGHRLGKFNDAIYAGTSTPATIYRLDISAAAQNEASNSFAEVFNFPDEPSDTSVEFMLPFLQTLIIGTGSPSGQAKLWITSDGETFQLLQILSGTHALCGTILNGIFYIGTKGGPLYKLSYSGTINNALRVESTGLTISSAIYSIYGFRDFLWVGTAGRIYKVNTDVNSANANQNAFTPQFLHTEQDSSISAIVAGNFHPVTASETQPPDDLLVFAAGGSNGRIVKSINGNPFGPSLQTITTPISQLKFNMDGVLHACVGRNLYKYNSRRSWEPVVTHTEEILDVAFDQTGVWLMGESGVRRVTFEHAKKKVYFALRDVAGNATNTPGETVAVADFEEISIDDLKGFVNQNRILELDEYGTEVSRYTGTGDTPFYSADKVEVERAEYYSEIFNGTTDHVTWDIIYWDAYVQEDTDLQIQVRAGITRDDVLSARFTKTFSKEDFEGGDISSLSGQFIQFKVIMTTEVRGKSPKLYRVNVRGLTRSSVHFFTTNFILPSKLNSIIVTANTITPVAADIVVGVDTNDSQDFSTYQPIELNRLAVLGPGQAGLNLRIGIKLISPLTVVNQTSEINEYDEYNTVALNNVIEFSYTATDDGSYNFAIEFYTDADMTDLATTLSTATTPTAWSADNIAFTDGGIAIDDGDTVNILAGIKGNVAIRCNQFYYVKLFVSKDNGELELIDAGLPFISGCNPTFVNILEVPFTNTGITANFHFRAKFYSDVTKTNLVRTFWSGLDQSGWTVNGSNISISGYPITALQSVTVDLIPEDLDAGIYYVSFDSQRSGVFTTVSDSYSIKITEADGEYCGEYTNVPIVKDLVAMFEIEDFLEKFGTSEKLRRTVLLNQ